MLRRRILLLLLAGLVTLGGAASSYGLVASAASHKRAIAHCNRGHPCPTTTGTTATTGTATTVTTTPTTAPTTTQGTTTSPPPTSYIFDDEFNGAQGSQPGSPWSIYTNVNNNWGNECFVNDAAHISMDGQGNLVLTATAPGATGTPCGGTTTFNSGGMRISLVNMPNGSGGLGGYKYGTAEARIKVPCSSGTGLWPAWWQDGTSWPTGGEIDSMEIMKDAPMHAQETIHGPNGTSNGWQRGFIGPLMDCNTFHTYGNIWSPGQIQFTVDGVVVKTFTPADVPAGGTWPFDSYPERIFLDLQGGVWGGTLDTSTLPQSMVIDYVRITPLP